MATLRRGLPRTRGGEAWPPAGVAVAGALGTAAGAVGTVAPGDAAPRDDRLVELENAAPSVPGAAESISLAQGAAAGMENAAPRAGEAAESISASADPARDAGVGATAGGSTLRRGLPRVTGGDPWPPAGALAAGAAAGMGAASEPPRALSETEADAQNTAGALHAPAAATAPAAAAVGPAASELDIASTAGIGSALRRGLPRVAGGDPWPPAGTAVLVEAAVESTPSEAAGIAVIEPDLASDTASALATAPAVPTAAVATRPDVSAPLPFTRTVWNGSAPRHLAAEPASRPRPTWPQAIGGLFAAAGLAVLAGAAIAIVRALCSLPFMQDFLTTYPGEYHLPAGAPVGIPGWIGWQHFFNVFLMTLIIRSGLRVRSEKRPTAFWTPRGNPKGKISLTLWFHQGLDLLWIINGVIFVVLLFVTGQWMRIVPTSWDVFPNALSAALQYVSFDWPTENGWVNYNSLQQLAYFTIVFLAAPVAIATGFRMSGLWPKKAEGLSKAYPIEIARAVHFPTMLFFTAFIVVHVALVLLTGMLRNLNHMFAAQDAVTWTGFWVFVLSLVVIAGGWAAARPLVLAPIAKVFGQVSGR